MLVVDPCACLAAALAAVQALTAARSAKIGLRSHRSRGSPGSGCRRSPQRMPTLAARAVGELPRRRVMVEPKASPTGEAVADVTGGLFPCAFGLSNMGSTPVQLPPERQGRCSIDIVNADGVSFGPADLDGCPLCPIEVELDEKLHCAPVPS